MFKTIDLEKDLFDDIYIIYNNGIHGPISTNNLRLYIYIHTYVIQILMMITKNTIQIFELNIQQSRLATKIPQHKTNKLFHFFSGNSIYIYSIYSCCKSTQYIHKKIYKSMLCKKTPKCILCEYIYSLRTIMYTYMHKRYIGTKQNEMQLPHNLNYTYKYMYTTLHIYIYIPRKY